MLVGRTRTPSRSTASVLPRPLCSESLCVGVPGRLGQAAGLRALVGTMLFWFSPVKETVKTGSEGRVCTDAN